MSPSGQFIISNFTLQDQGRVCHITALHTVIIIANSGNYTCYDGDVKVDEVEVRVPYNIGESQSELQSSAQQSEDDISDGNYLR